MTSDSTPPPNLNLRRRLGPGLLAFVAAAPLRLLLLPLRSRTRLGRAGNADAHVRVDAPVLMFSSYMVGDLFMALPAIKRLATAVDLRVVCRPDCADLLTREGLQPVPFDNAFLTRRTPIAFLRTVREAWRLRRLKAGFAIDPDADPRSALWLRIAGAARVFSYRRDFGTLFDETFALPPEAIHQADRDMAVAEEFLRRHSSVDGLCDDPSSDGWGARGNPSPGGLETSANDPSQPSWQRTPKNPHTIPASDTEEPPNPHRSSLITHHPLPPWLLSVWTRKPAKNWPLERWSEFMERLQREGVPFAVLHAPDGDSAFQLFRARWDGRVTFVEGDLGTIADSVSAAEGVIATDNFLGHMAGYYGKPVLWINIASPAAQVEPRGPCTVRVQAGDEGHPRRPGDLSVDAISAAFTKLRMPPPT